jgi:hypothetical protein
MSLTEIALFTARTRETQIHSEETEEMWYVKNTDPRDLDSY